MHCSSSFNVLALCNSIRNTALNMRFASRLVLLLSLVLGSSGAFAGSPAESPFGTGATPKKDDNPAGKNEPRNAAAPKTGVFVQAVDDARKAMAQRNLAAAQKYVDTASKNAKDQDQLAQVDRLKTLLEYLRQFWDGIRTAMAKLNVTDEIVLRGSQVIVVESSRDAVVVRAAGKNRRYAIDTLPTAFVMVLADECFAKDVDSRVVIGAFLAVDPKGDRATAKKYWLEGAAADIDTEKLIPEMALFPITSANGEPKPEPSVNKPEEPQDDDMAKPSLSF
jgi:hypothetical protein